MISDIAVASAAGTIWALRSLAKRQPLPLPPMVAYADERQKNVTTTVTYARGQKLDIWGPAPAFSGAPCPVMLFIPGGGWMLGERRPQGYALMSHLVRHGWICVAIDYRTAPVHQWPAPYDDVIEAIAWVRDNIARYGGSDFLAVAGASAGGHMASLAGLTASHMLGHRPDAVVSLYGSYDWESRRTPWRKTFMTFLETVVVGKRQATHPEIFNTASPMANVHPGAPPFLIVHGDRDNLISVKEARRFRDTLADVSEETVQYLEIKGGIHAFDLAHPGQTLTAVATIENFLYDVYQDHRPPKNSAA
ncbi:alpha/beta hydrolase [Mycolicibacterium sp. S2-37]|uniref:alpha/beta hydrolase n=1 Tax=Mycolicibacterium sp. S2-37 TaxID=2810297 RepID=UPI001A94D62D|nr:alpha/beta hydrolase [Mycolicibacterium sp. S2-37]MBO0676923.1 alpha/beta hydrolase [Mycolicibacterium sp. S2-37]